jgi:hypothetical protein
VIRAGGILILAIVLNACGEESEVRSVDLATTRVTAEEAQGWSAPAIESGHAEITVRQIFTARGRCRELHADLVPTYPGEYLLRVVATEMPGCGNDTPHIAYTATLKGLPEGQHQLRIVHVGADGRTLAETALEHPILVTRPRSGR